MKSWYNYTFSLYFSIISIKKAIAFQLSQTYNPIDFLSNPVVESCKSNTDYVNDSWCESLITIASSFQKLTKCL